MTEYETLQAKAFRNVVFCDTLFEVSVLPDGLMKKVAKRPRGRPKLDETMQQIAVRLPTDLVAEIDAMVLELRKDPLVRAERSAMIRALLTEAIKVRRRKRPRSRRPA